MNIFGNRSKNKQYRSLGDKARNEKRWNDAVANYSRYLSHYPKDADIHVQYGHALKESGKTPEAERAYKRALELNPNESDTYLQLGHLYKLTNRPQAAIEAYREALNRDASLQSAAAELGILQAGSWAASPNPRPPDQAIESHDQRLQPLIRHMTSLLEQLSTLKAISFEVARLKTGLERSEQQHQVTQQGVRHIEGRMAELPQLVDAHKPELRALATGMRKLMDQGLERTDRLTVALADIDARMDERSQQVHEANQIAATVSSRLDQLNAHVHLLSEASRGTDASIRDLRTLHERVETLERRTHEPAPPPEMPLAVNQMLQYLAGRIEFVRREVMYEFQHGAKSADAVRAATEVQSQIKNQEKLEAARKSGIRLNLGCGHIMLDDYLNVDRRDLTGIDIMAEADNLPFAPGEVETIHSAHLLEHFPEQEMRRSVLPYWRSLLKPGGQLTAILPDGAAMLAHAGAGDYKFEEFREVLFGAQDYIGDYHYALYTPASLTALLEETGFGSIQVLAEGRRNGLCYEFEISAERADEPTDEDTPE